MTGVRFRIIRDQAGPLFEEIAARAGEAKPPLRRMGALLKAGVVKAMKDNAPAKAAATLAKEAKTGTSSVTAQGKVRASYARQLAQTFKRKGDVSAAEALSRVMAGDLSTTTGNRTVDRLRRRLQTAQAAREIGATIAIGKRRSEKNAPRGGKMVGANKVILGRLSVKVQNAVRYSAAHDEGGTVGNGAVLPRWDFMYIDAAGAEMCAEIALDWILEGKK